MSLSSSTPINPPLQAIVNEVDAYGRVQSLELSFLRAFDSASPPIELVAESSPTPLRRSLSAKAASKDASSSLSTSKEPSPSTSESTTSHPPPGTLHVKLSSFVPYAAIFKVNSHTNTPSPKLILRSIHSSLMPPNRSLAFDLVLCRSTLSPVAAATLLARSFPSRP